MPLPSFLMPDVLQPVPRAQQAPAQAFPYGLVGRGLLDQAQRAQAFRRGFGDLPPGPGLLDTTPYRLPLGMQPATAPPPGLLQPAMWDRARRNSLGLLGTEGVRGLYAGGGKAVPQGELSLEGGQTISRNLQPTQPTQPRNDWSYSEMTGSYATTTPDGVRVFMTPKGFKQSGEIVDMDFTGPSGGFQGPKKPMSTQRGIDRLGQVFDALKDYVTKFKPSEIHFTGSSDKHDMFYNRVAPAIANSLGGKLEAVGKPGARSFRIIFGE